MKRNKWIALVRDRESSRRELRGQAREEAAKSRMSSSTELRTCREEDHGQKREE